MRSFRNITLGVTLAILITSPAYAASEDLSLFRALDIALIQHIDVIVANERVIQSLARIQQRSAPLLPQLRGSVSETRQTRDLRSVGIPLPGDPLVGPFNVYDARVQLTQTIFDPAALIRFKSSQQGHVLSLAQQEKVREDVLVLVASLFIDAKRAQDSLRVSQSEMNRDKKEMSITHSRFESGLSSSLEMKKVRVAYARALYHLETAKREALERKLDLAAALNLPQDQDFHFVWDSQVFMKSVPGTKSDDDQPDVNVAREQLKLDERDRIANKWDFLPRVAVSGDYGPSGLSPSDSSETYGLGVSATIPIFEGGSQQARLKESQSVVKISQAQLQSVKRAVEANVTTQQAIVLQAQALLKEQEDHVIVAQEELHLAHGKFQAGTGSALGMTFARVGLEQARDQKDEARAYYLMAKINLARALGKVEQFLLER